MKRTFQRPTNANEQAETIQCLRTGLFVRSLALARLALSTSREFRDLWALSGDAECDPTLREKVDAQAAEIARELGSLKGSVMKVGQLLSMFGEHFLPPHVNSVLKSMQCDSVSMDWSTIEPTLRRELGPKFDDLEIEPFAISAASIGQVHKAVIKSNGHKLAIKIQYPVVERAIESDLKALKTILAFAPGVPKGERMALLVREIEEMLHREIDYRSEAGECDRFRKLLSNDSRFLVPSVNHHFSSGKVIALDLICGHRIDSEAVMSLSQERRDHIGQAMLELYMKELFEFGCVQTDPHIGNFRIRLQGEVNVDGSTNDQDKIVLLDFGAVRTFAPEFLSNYTSLVKASIAGDRAKISKLGMELGFLVSCDPEKVHEAFHDFCRLIVEPFRSEGTYCWVDNDLPSRLARQLAVMVRSREFRPPPREVLFLDRKSSGLYVLLRKLGARTDARHFEATFA